MKNKCGILDMRVVMIFSGIVVMNSIKRMFIWRENKMKGLEEEGLSFVEKIKVNVGDCNIVKQHESVKRVRSM